MILLGLAMYSEMRFRVCFSISLGWSPMGTCKRFVSGDKLVEAWKRHYLGQTREINKRQVEDMGRIDFEVDWLSVDALIRSCNSGRLVFNLALNVGKVCEFPVGDVVELGPF